MFTFDVLNPSVHQDFNVPNLEFTIVEVFKHIQKDSWSKADSTLLYYFDVLSDNFCNQFHFPHFGVQHKFGALKKHSEKSPDPGHSEKWITPDVTISMRWVTTNQLCNQDHNNKNGCQRLQTHRNARHILAKIE